MAYSGRRVKQLRELLGLTQTDLAVRLEVSQGLIAQIERGSKPASEDFVRKIGRTSGFPAAFFTRDPIIEFPADSLLFRSHADISKFEVSQAARYAEMIAEITHALLQSVSLPPLRIPTLSGCEPNKAAHLTREALGIAGNEPIENLTRVIERAGVLVFAVPTTLPGRDAYSLWWENRPVIATVHGATGARLRMSVAHELGHLVLKHGKLTNASDERLAYSFAGEFLAPEIAMRREITTPVTLSALAQLKPRWRLAIQALVRRARDLQIISERQYGYLNAQISAKGWKKKEPGEFAPEKPRLLRQICEDVRGIRPEKLAAELAFGEDFVRSVIDCYEEKSNTRLELGQKVTVMRR